MEVLQFLAFASLAIAILSILVGLTNYKLYWLGVIALYNFSFLTIRITGLAAIYVLLALIIGHCLGWVSDLKRACVAALLGLSAWMLCISLVDDYWLFLPLHKLYEYAGWLQ